MNYLDRNTLPKFQERLDLAASDLNDMEDIFTKAINELAGRIYILGNLVPEEDRSKYAEETNFLLLSKIQELEDSMSKFLEEFESMKGMYDQEIESLDSKYLDLERRLNYLDDAAARKEDLNTLLWRSGKEN